MVDRTLLCAPLLVPAFLAVALFPARPDTSPAPEAVSPARDEAPLTVTVTAAPSADPAQAAPPRHEGCSGGRKAALPAVVTSTT